MARIVEDGDNKEWSRVCDSCDSTIAYRRNDIKRRTKDIEGLGHIYTEYGGLFGNKIKKHRETNIMEVEETYVICPRCGEDINLNSKVKNYCKSKIVEEIL